MISIISIWALFGVVHSLTATDRAKRLALGHTGLTLTRYRQIYNLLALATLLVALYVSHSNLTTELVVWRGAWIIVPVVAWSIAAVFFIIAAINYDLADFVGTGAKSSDPRSEAQPATIAGRLSFSWSHRFVRHPWYFAMLLMLWVRNLTTGWVVANICITAYVIIGMVCEESRLQRDYGSVWRQYKSAVPALLPLPGRTMSMSQLDNLAAQSADESRDRV